MCSAGKAGKVTSSVQRTASSKAASAASHLSGLWTKAPPKKPPTADPKPEKAVAGGKKGRAVKTSGPAPAADAEAALRAAQKVRSVPCACQCLWIVCFHGRQNDTVHAQDPVTAPHKLFLFMLVQEDDSSDDDGDDLQPKQRGDAAQILLMCT